MLTALGSKEAEMKIIGCDLHAAQQTIAMLDRETGEIVEKTLKHEADTVREFYAALPGPVVVGLEATGAMGCATRHRSNGAKRHCDANRNGVECDMRLRRTIHLAASLAAMGLAVGCRADISTSPSPSLTASSPIPPLTSTLTLTASARCAVVTDWVTHRSLTFPDAARVRHFPAALTDSALFVSIHRDPFAASRAGNELTVIVPPSAQELNNRDGSAVWQNALQTQVPSRGGGDYWYDGFGTGTPNGYLEDVEVCGTWHAHIADPSNISGTIDGSFVYYRGIAPKFETVLYCRASDHQFMLTTP